MDTAAAKEAKAEAKAAADVKAEENKAAEARAVEAIAAEEARLGMKVTPARAAAIREAELAKVGHVPLSLTPTRSRTSPPAPVNVNSPRARFTLTDIKLVNNVKTLVFSPHEDATIPETQRIMKSGAAGVFEVAVDNPKVFDKFVLGTSYYVDFTPVGTR